MSKDIKSAIIRSLSACKYRYASGSWAGGEHTTVVLVGGSVPDAIGTSRRVWSRNGKWSGLNSRHEITVPADWDRSVRRRGLAVVDGLLTLSAERVATGAYQCVWVEQGRGFALRLVDGYIARADRAAPWCHGSTAEGARRTSARRARAAAAEAVEIAEASRTTYALADILAAAERGELGACAAGVRDWAEKHMPGRASATGAEILEVARECRDRAALVRLVVIGMLRRRAQQAQGVAA